jgi:hypothetical protein
MPFQLPDPSDVEDAKYLRLLESEKSKTELISFWKHWGLNDGDLSDSFQTLSINGIKTKHEDLFVETFQKGENASCSKLFDKLKASLSAHINSHRGAWV